MWHQWFNHSVIKLPEYFLYAKKAQITTLFKKKFIQKFVSFPLCIRKSTITHYKNFEQNKLHSAPLNNKLTILLRLWDFH